MKTYTINGKEIKFDGGGVVQLLLEALDEKKEEIEGNWINCPNCFPGFPKTPEPKKEEPKSGTHVGILLGDDEGVENVTYDGKEIYSKEPKSTLREATLKIVRTVADLQAEPVADKIISLFKDTLLKEVQKAEPLRIPGESLEFTSGQEWTMRQIKQIIKNL